MSEQAKDSKPDTTNEVALEMMKFIANTTGYGKGSGSAGFQGKATRTIEEHADSLLELFEKCRATIKKG